MNRITAFDWRYQSVGPYTPNMSCSARCFLVLCSFGSAFAQTSASEAPRPNAQVQQFMDDKVAMWRQRLKLEDWQISAAMIRRSDLAPQTLGGIHWDKSKKTAVIWVLDPSDYRLPLREM